MLRRALMALVVVCVWVFGVLAVLVVFRVTDTAEMPLVRAALGLRTGWLTDALVPITFVSSSIPAGLICLGLSAQRWWRARPRTWRAVVCAVWPLLALLMAAGLNIGLRVAIGRMRPSVDYIPSGFLEVQAAFQRFSFPSGHATGAVAAFLALVICLRPHPRWRGLALLMALVVILGTGFGRVYLGVHWPSDVLGGYLLGLACVISAWLLAHPGRVGNIGSGVPRPRS